MRIHFFLRPSINNIKDAGRITSFQTDQSLYRSLYRF